MQADFPVILDACVLAPPRLCDLLLRLAEHPRLYLPKWTNEILEETVRTQRERLKPPFPPDLADYWRQQVTKAFPEAMIAGFEHLTAHMTNSPKDRHIVAAAVHERVSTIVTFNLRDFSPEHLTPWKIDALHPQDFLLGLHGLNPGVVTGKLGEIAQYRQQSLPELLSQLGKRLPLFSSRVAEDMGLT